jgi:hypothetical protein
MAIKQKLMANQRAADLEMACESPIQGAKRTIRQTANNHSNYQREPRTVRYPQQQQQQNNGGQNGNPSSQFSPRNGNPK